MGIALDSRQVVQGTKALDDLARAAKPAEAATTSLGKASTTATTALGNHAKSVNDAGKAHAGLSTQAMAAQHSIRSMVEAVASGQPITQALGQQLNHLSYAATGPGGISGAFKAATGSLLGLLSPTTLVVGGLAAVAVAGGLAVANVAKSGKAFDDTSRSIGVTLGYLHALESSAAIKGIDTPDFLKAMDRFGASVYDAQHGMGGLAETFRANNTSAKSFSDYLEKAAELIKTAGSDQQRLQMLQEMGLPATMDWVRLLSSGKDGIRAATAEAQKFGDSAEANLVAKARKFDEEWTKGVKNLTTGLRNATLQGSGWLDSLSDGATKLLMKIPGIGAAVPTNMLRNALQDRAAGLDVGSQLKSSSDVSSLYAGTGAGNASAGPKIKTAAERQKEISDQQAYIGLLGQTATAEQAAEQVRLAADASYLSSGVKVSQSKLSQLQQLAIEQSNGVAAIKASTDAQNVEAATVGMSVGATAQYTAEQNALNAAKQKGTILSDASRAQISSEASALGQAAAQADNMRFAYTSLVQGPMQTFNQAIQNGSTAMDALKKAGISALSALANKLTDMAAQNLWGAAFGGSGGGSGFLSSLFGGGGTVANGGIVLGGPNGPGTFADGGYTGSGGKYQPAGIVHKGEYVMDAATTSRIGVGRLNALRGYADGGYVSDRVSLPPGLIRDTGASANRGGSNGGGFGPSVIMQDNRTIHIGAGASQETVAQLKDALVKDRAARFEETVAIVKRAKTGRQL